LGIPFGHAIISKNMCDILEDGKGKGKVVPVLN